MRSGLSIRPNWIVWRLLRAGGLRLWGMRGIWMFCRLSILFRDRRSGDRAGSLGRYLAINQLCERVGSVQREVDSVAALWVSGELRHVHHASNLPIWTSPARPFPPPQRGRRRFQTDVPPPHVLFPLPFHQFYRVRIPESFTQTYASKTHIPNPPPKPTQPHLVL